MAWNDDAASTSNLCYTDKVDENFEYLKTKRDQLAETYATLEALFSALSSLPVSTLFAYTKNTPPAGYLECNGAAISRTTYADLFNIIGTAYGIGNGSTTFNIPDFRGKFIRGFDNSAGVDIGRVFGSYQGDSLITHTHGYSDLSPTSSGIGAVYGYPAFYVSASYLSTTTTTTASGNSGSESRPRNVALLYCIKY